VTFLVKEKYAAEARKGFTMYHLNRGVKPVRFEGFGVITAPAAGFDQVVLTVASPALKGPWLEELVAATGDATIVALQPGLDDRKRLLAAGAGEHRLVQGLITLISYHAPLAGETRFPEPGMAYWFPPLAPAPFSGPAERLAAVVGALKAGRQPVKKHEDVAKMAGFPTAVLMPYLVALELGGWRIKGAVEQGTLTQAGRAVREATAVVARIQGKPPLLIRALARPRLLRALVFVARPFIPLPLETYLAAHFTKVGEQTRDFMQSYIDKGRAAGLPVDTLAELSARLPRLKAS
jgi:2-dehydropantoate 2-reductase